MRHIPTLIPALLVALVLALLLAGMSDGGFWRMGSSSGTPTAGWTWTGGS